MNHSGRRPDTEATHTWEHTLRRTLGEAGAEAVRELQVAISYVNDRVVPQVRRHSMEAMHSASQRLRRLADRLESAAASTRRAAGE